MASPKASPMLPPVAGASPTPSSTGGSRRRTGAARGQDATKRREFLGGLLNEDLQHLTQWHGDRPAHEQKRFLKSVDMLYKNFTQMEHGGARGRQQQQGPSPQQARAQQHAAAAAAAAALEAENDPFARPGTPPARAQLTSSHSAPSLPSKPIEVFENARRVKVRGEQKDPNTLARWLEAQSNSSMSSSATNQTRMTTFSQLTRTTSAASSICSMPGTTNQGNYRVHKRGIAVNQMNWAAADQNAAAYLKDGLGSGFPEAARFSTAAQEAFGSRPLGENILPGMYRDVVQSDRHKFVDQFLDTAPPEHREQFAGMCRSLQFLRREDGMRNKSMSANDLNLNENRRLFHPKTQRAVVDASQTNYSQVPLGTCSFIPGQTRAQPPATPESVCPRSPSVSNLGSVCLSPRSIASPMLSTSAQVGATNLAEVREALATVVEE